MFSGNLCTHHVPNTSRPKASLNLPPRIRVNFKQIFWNLSCILRSRSFAAICAGLSLKWHNKIYKKRVYEKNNRAGVFKSSNHMIYRLQTLTFIWKMYENYLLFWSTFFYCIQLNNIRDLSTRTNLKQRFEYITLGFRSNDFFQVRVKFMVFPNGNLFQSLVKCIFAIKWYYRNIKFEWLLEYSF